MRTCSSLAQVLGIGKESLDVWGDRQGSGNAKLAETERATVAWTIAMLERYDRVQKCFESVRVNNY
jgi:hypothetical protein